jgi:integrase
MDSSKILDLLNDSNKSPSTVKTYVNNLKRLNNKKDYKNLNFLSNFDSINNIISKFKPNTQRNYIISIVAVLSLLKDKDKKYNKLYNHYRSIMDNKNNVLKSEEKKHNMSEKQKDNWIDWDTINNKMDDLYTKAMSDNPDKKDLLHALILGFYVLTPPRRNKDYYNMYVVKSKKEATDNTKNYFLIKDKKFIFNSFKTKKSEGQQILNIPDKLYKLLLQYIKVNKINDGELLLSNNGKIYNVNTITFILNKIFNKKIGSTMLRHIFLSNKYGDVLNEKEEDAKAMGHSVNMQNDYIKKK